MLITESSILKNLLTNYIIFFYSIILLLKELFHQHFYFSHDEYNYVTYDEYNYDYNVDI